LERAEITLSAIEAAEQLARATDPAVREALVIIAADEARHAELAWRTVAWAISAGGERVRAAVSEVFETTLRGVASMELDIGVESASAGVPEDYRVAHGRLGEPLRATIARRALTEVIAPCSKGLANTLWSFERFVALARCQSPKPL
jgi:hypothetical protein